MKNNSIRKMVLAALFTALCCALTMVMFPFTAGGYIHMGDVFVLAAGWILGPVYGTFAAALGSALADVFLGYVLYAPGTFIIKACVALCASLLFKALKKTGLNGILSKMFSGIVAELIMVVGYLFYTAFIFEEGLAALVTTPFNMLQGAFGIAVGIPVVALIEKILVKIDKSVR